MSYQHQKIHVTQVFTTDMPRKLAQVQLCSHVGDFLQHAGVENIGDTQVVNLCRNSLTSKMENMEYSYEV